MSTPTKPISPETAARLRAFASQTVISVPISPEMHKRIEAVAKGMPVHQWVSATVALELARLEGITAPAGKGEA